MTGKKEYSNGEVIVVWEPSRCIHSAKCLAGLPRVFNNHLRPWINMQGASSEAITRTVLTCPSGAISMKEDAGQAMPASDTVVITQVTDGPLRVKGSCIIVDEAGHETRKNESFTLCRCGGSLNKPFCDGSHKRNGFKSMGEL